MEGGLIFSEATKRATLDYIKSVPRLDRVRKAQDAKLVKSLTSKASSGSNLTAEERDAFLTA